MSARFSEVWADKLKGVEHKEEDEKEGYRQLFYIHLPFLYLFPFFMLKKKVQAAVRRHRQGEGEDWRGLGGGHDH